MLIIWNNGEGGWGSLSCMMLFPFWYIPSWHSGVVITSQRRCWCCHNVVARSKIRVVLMSVSDVVKTLLQRFQALNFKAILLRTILISFPSSKCERVTKVLSGIKHTSFLFKIKNVVFIVNKNIYKPSEIY